VNWNVIVSIDGNDGTEGIVKGMMREYSFISYDKNHVRGGKGWAIKRVVNRASGEFTILMDADGSISFSDIIKAMNMTESYDVIIFDRYSGNKSEIPLIRRISSRGLNILVKVLLGIKVNDTQCGYKIIRTYMLKEAFTEVAVTNAFFDVDLLYHLNNIKPRINIIKIDYRHDGNCKFNVFSSTVGHGISLMAFRLRHSRFYKYVPDWARELYSRKFKWI